MSVEPDILIVDEALAVGDVRFQQKCFRKFKEFKNSGRTILFVSHDMGVVKMFCNHVLWLDNGKIRSSGPPEKITKEYLAYMTYGLETMAVQENISENKIQSEYKSGETIEWQSTSGYSSFGEGGAIIVATALYSKARSEPILLFEGGEEVVYYVKVISKISIESPIVGFILNDDHGVHLLGYNSHNLGLKLEPLNPGDIKTYCFHFKFPRLKQGAYLFSPAIAEGTPLTHTQYHWVHDAYVVQVVNPAEIANIGCYFIPEQASFVELVTV